MEEIIIQKVSVDDVNNLQSLAILAYSETFGPHNTKENLEAYLSRAFSAEQLVKEIKERESQWYIASLENENAGYLKVNFGNAQTELQDEKAIEIERIYVLQRFQGNNIGKLLLEKAIDIARLHKVDYIWLGVWEKNWKALSFYKRHGFSRFGQHSFFLGDDEQTDWLMKLSVQEPSSSISGNE